MVHSPCRCSLDGFQAMYESIRVDVPHQPVAASESSASTSAPPQLSPTSTSPASQQHAGTVIGPDEHGFDTLDDLEAIQRERRFIDLDPRAVLLLRAMAADFSEGRLETFVGKPQKELPGTKDAYVSYCVTTKVGCHIFCILFPPSSAIQSVKRQAITAERSLTCPTVRLPVIPAL